MRARDHNALVHVEAQIAQPGFVGKVGNGLAGTNAALEQREDAPSCVRGNRLVVDARRGIRPQTKRMLHEPCRLVVGVCGAMAEGEPGCAKTVGAVTHQRADRARKLRGRHGLNRGRRGSA